MRVSETGNSPIQSTETGSTQKSGKAQKYRSSDKPAETSHSSSSASASKAEISGRAKEMAKAKDVASNAPDVREDRIAELRRRIAAGKYEVDADAVADRMFEDHIKSGIG